MAKSTSTPAPAASSAFRNDNLCSRCQADLRQTERSTYCVSPTCVYCGYDIAQPNFSIDHMTPLSLGGSDSLDNLVPSHIACNSKKKNIHFVDYCRVARLEQFK